jgi:hypothetical protein
MFLTILTGTYARPTYFAKQQASLKNQTCQDFVNIVREDTVRIGIPGQNKWLQKQECESDYIWVFDDDDEITDKTFIERIKEICDKEKPDVVIVPSWQGMKTIGNKEPLAFGNAGTINIISSKEIWYKCRKNWLASQGGDWQYIYSVLQTNPKIYRFKELMLRSQVVSYGRTEEESTRDMNIGKHVNILQGCGGTWGGYQMCDSPVLITEKNSVIIESLIRGKIAELIK